MKENLNSAWKEPESLPPSVVLMFILPDSHPKTAESCCSVLASPSVCVCVFFFLNSPIAACTRLAGTSVRASPLLCSIFDFASPISQGSRAERLAAAQSVSGICGQQQQRRAR